MDAEIVKGTSSDYVRFSPKKIGSTTVTVTDIIGVDYKRVPVTVYETGVAVAVYDVEIDIDADSGLDRDIENSILQDIPLAEGNTYVFSNQQKGIFTILDEDDRIEGAGEFHHTTIGQYPFLVITDDGDSRELRVVADIATGSHSYSLFYGITVPAGTAGRGNNFTRDEQIKSSQVWYLEDLTDLFESEYPNRVNKVTVTYVCNYEFAPFIEPEVPAAED